MKHELLVLFIVLGMLNALRLLLHPQNSDSLNANTSLIFKRARKAQLAGLVLEVDFGHSVLHQRLAVVEVQGSLGTTIQARRNNDVEALLAQRGRRVSALDALRVDDAALVVDGDIGVVDVGGDVFAMSANRLAGSPFVEDVVGQVVAQARAVLLGHRADEDAVAVEELQVDGVGTRVVGIVEEEGVQRGRAGLVLLVERRVDVVNWTWLARVIIGVPLNLRSWYRMAIPLRAALATLGQR